jgi:hypothetical protein
MCRFRLVTLAAGIVVAFGLVACSGSSKSNNSSKSSAAGSASNLSDADVLATAVGIAGGSGFGNGSLSLPKVPFNNDPCQALSAADQTSLGLSTSVAPKPDKAPAGLSYSNVCVYDGVTVQFQAKVDYDFNHDGNQSTSRKAPSDLPGGFYDRQAGLWFTKNGYYVVITASSSLAEKAAHIVVAKLQ